MIGMLAVVFGATSCGRAQPPPSDITRGEAPKVAPKAEGPIFVWSGPSDGYGYLRVELWGAGKGHQLVIKSSSRTQLITHRGILTTLPKELCTPLTAQVFARSDSDVDAYQPFVPISAAIADDGSLRLYLMDGLPFLKPVVLRPAN